jgi:hypothetical protein
MKQLVATQKMVDAYETYLEDAKQGHTTELKKLHIFKHNCTFIC